MASLDRNCLALEGLCWIVLAVFGNVKMEETQAKSGVLLVNVGTPEGPDAESIKAYLREFLMDPLVIGLPTPFRWLLVNGLIAPFRTKKSAMRYSLIWKAEGSPLLVHSRAFARKVQEELGYLPREAIEEIARTLRISASEVYGVITFYAQFRTTPRGRHIVRVCRGTACHVRGGSQVLDAVKRDLGVGDNETTEDLEYTLETVACIGACALAPAMVIDEDTFGQVTPAKVTRNTSSAMNGQNRLVVS